MKHRDFHAGQSALGLMTRNTEAMFAPRMAQWEAFGKGLQDANAIVQNRHAFNEQLEQNRIQNEFKNKEFGFREKEAEESKRRFDTQMQEEKNQFWARHALDKENSAYDNKLKQSQADYNYWRMGEEKKEKQKQLTLKTKAISDEISNGLQLLNQGKEIMELAPKVAGIIYGIKKKINDWSDSFIDLNNEENDFVARNLAFRNAYLKDLYKSNVGEAKIEDFKTNFDQDLAGHKQRNHRMAQMNLDKIARMEEQIKSYKTEMGVSDELLTPTSEKLKELKAYFTAFTKGESPVNSKGIVRIYKEQDLLK